MAYGYVYLITNTVNDKHYVGQTVQTIELRWSQHLRERRDNHNRHLRDSIRKYGKGAFTVETLFEADSHEELDSVEAAYVEAYQSTDRKLGYNIRAGGSGGGHLGDETKERIAASLRGRTPPNKGKAMPEHQRLAMIERIRTEGHWLKGRHHVSEDGRKRIAVANRINRLGSKASESIKCKMSNAQQMRWDSKTIEERLAHGSSRKGVQRSPEDRKRISDGHATPERVEYRKRIIEMRDSGMIWNDIAAVVERNRATVMEIYQRHAERMKANA